MPRGGALAASKIAKDNAHEEKDPSSSSSAYANGKHKRVGRAAAEQPASAFVHFAPVKQALLNSSALPAVAASVLRQHLYFLHQ
jgi:hypothetical protein